MQTLKLTAKRRRWFGDLLSGKAGDLLADPVGLRDLKSLFKQLAKAFHPDLEPDPLLKRHKEVWMKRLNTAYAATAGCWKSSPETTRHPAG